MSEQQPSPASPSARRVRLPRNRWARRGVFAVLGLLALWALGWLALPPLARWQGEKIASEQLGRPVHIGAVDFKPWTLELTLSDLRVGGAPGAAADLLRVKRVYLDAELQSLARLAPVVDAIQVDAPELHLTHLGEGRYDIDDILARLAARPRPAEPSEPARFALYNIELKDGRIDFDDRAVDRTHEVRGLRLTLPFISNLPSQREVKVLPRLAFTANGSAFDSSAQALPFEESRQTGAVLRLAGLDLKPYLGYLPAGLPLRLQAATVDADLRLGFVQLPQPSLRLGGTLAVSGLKSVDAQGGEALAFDALKLQLGDVRPLERQVQLASVELNGPQVAVRRRADGQINLLLQSPADAPESGAASAPSTGAGGQNDAESAAWQVAIDKLAVHGGTVDFSDETTVAGDVPAATLRLNEVELAAATLAWPMARTLTFSGSAALVGTEGLTPALPEAAPRRRGAARAQAP
ncbi:DUF748 domain-containing protein, partial [Ottowia sp.]|uniref:DUF748 domain-containing protein n=1 Tax=Ottowia sp. TaxID=1898956 RepID=UPI0039E37082